jgi:fatty-acyl-CoA synthase
MGPLLAEAIARSGQQQPDRGFTFDDGQGSISELTFSELEAQTARIAAGLQACGLDKGDRLGLSVLEPREFVLVFLAAVRAGIVPVPLFPPMALGGIERYAERTARILERAGARALYTSRKLELPMWGVVHPLGSGCPVLTEGSLATDGAPRWPSLAADDLAFLQFTSGSTAEPKGVRVTHGALKANAAAIAHGLALDPSRDVGVSWLPLYHDMGLVGFVCTPVMLALSVVLLPTLAFLKRPNAWLDALHRHRGTISFAPPFAFSLATRRAGPTELGRWDLSCVRALGCGAEPIRPRALQEFCALFEARARLPQGVVLPAYGLAEATLAVAFAPLGQPIRAIALPGSEAGEVVSCGPPLPGFELRIRDPQGTTVADGTEGEVWLRGPSLAAGYFEAPLATAQTFLAGWLRTGDLGLVERGELFVTGRLKDLIIIRGRNVHPQDVEWAAAKVDGVRAGGVAAFACQGEATEALVVAVESKAVDGAALQEAICTQVREALDLEVAQVVLLPPGSLPKTSSGKLQRAHTRELYLRGALGRRVGRPSGTQGANLGAVRHLARSLWSWARSGT